MTNYRDDLEPTEQLHVRIPKSTYELLRSQIQSKHGLGVIVNEALLAYLNRKQGAVDVDTLAAKVAEALIRKLKEKL